MSQNNFSSSVDTYKNFCWLAGLQAYHFIFDLSSDCQESLGVSNGLIKDSQFTASSSYDEHHQPYHARLNKTVKGSRGGWCSAFADETEFLEVNLGNRRSISGEEMFCRFACIGCYCYWFGLITLTRANSSAIAATSFNASLFCQQRHFQPCFQDLSFLCLSWSRDHPWFKLFHEVRVNE